MEATAAITIQHAWRTWSFIQSFDKLSLKSKVEKKTKERNAARIIQNKWRIFYYKKSLNELTQNIQKSTKSLKDIVGYEYEQHRKRIYEFNGLIVSKRKPKDINYNADWFVYNKTKQLVAIEEDKGHYVDSCFLDRAVFSFAKIISKYLKNKEDCPKLILSSFTTYKLYNKKMIENYDVLRQDIIDVMKEKLVYQSICPSDRLSRDIWFQKQNKEKNPYIENVTKTRIIEDIKLIHMHYSYSVGSGKSVESILSCAISK